jgi:amino acid transporter/mannitol/fructose-specific phosphotransferase system IIA component (Ntr-type)
VARGQGNRLNKELRLFDVYVLALGPMLSSGFFLLPGLAAAKTGGSVALAYLLAGALVFPAMLSKAELATAMPRAGGTYYYFDRSLGPIMGTVGGLGTWLTLSLKSAFALIGMGAYLVLFLDAPIRPVAIALTVTFAVVAWTGARMSARLQRVLVTTVLGFLLLFFAFGIFFITGGDGAAVQERFSPFLTHGLEGLLATTGLVFVSYAGLTKVASVSEEVSNPDRSIPLGMFLALTTASLVYLLGVSLMVAVLDSEVLHGDLTPVATAGLAFLDWIPRSVALPLLVLPALAGFAAAGNAGIMAASRFPFAMGRDRLLSKRFAELSRYRTPTLGILTTASLMILAIATLDVVGVAKLASTFKLLVFALVNLSVIVMRESGLASYDPGYRSPLYPWLQIFGLLGPFLLIAVMGLMPILFTLGLIAVGLGWYFYYARPRVARYGALYHWFERLGQRRYEGLDTELRGILKEKGLRAEDPFDEVVGRAVVVDLPDAASFEDAVRRASGLLSQRLPLGAQRLAEGFLHGTRTGATPVSHGAALPHLRLPEADSPELALVRSRAGVNIAIGDQFADDRSHGMLIHALFFLVSPEENPGQHLRLLAGIAERVDDEDFMEAWLSSREYELKEAILRDERFLSLSLAEEAPSGALIGRSLSGIDMPPGTLVALIRRGPEILVPRGRTVLATGDRLSIVGDPTGIREIRERYRGT